MFPSPTWIFSLGAIVPIWHKELVIIHKSNDILIIEWSLFSLCNGIISRWPYKVKLMPNIILVCILINVLIFIQLHCSFKMLWIWKILMEDYTEVFIYAICIVEYSRGASLIRTPPFPTPQTDCPDNWISGLVRHFLLMNGNWFPNMCPDKWGSTVYLFYWHVWFKWRGGIFGVKLTFIFKYVRFNSLVLFLFFLHISVTCLYVATI